MMAEETVVDKKTGGDSIPTEIYTKHPLQNIWEMWYYKTVSKNYEDNLFKITSVDTVEDFWGLYNHVESVKDLGPGSAYYFFKQGIRPMWEDDINKNGGRLLINSNKRNGLTDKYWMEILLSLIGESYGDNNDYICGAFVNVKPKFDRVGIWTKTTDRDVNQHVGSVLKKSLEYNGTINYDSHDSSPKVAYEF